MKRVIAIFLRNQSAVSKTLRSALSEPVAGWESHSPVVTFSRIFIGNLDSAGSPRSRRDTFSTAYAHLLPCVRRGAMEIGPTT
ncbi:MAG: hypothetical protein GYB66_03410 [Chloroflexi bacterium]|nr:hypothetical protein [Chloroflexota bacterium]